MTEPLIYSVGTQVVVQKETYHVIQEIIGRLVRSRDARRDAFANSMEKALCTSLGSDADEATKALAGHGISMNLIKSAITAMAANGGGFTVFRVVDALTRLTGRLINAGDRMEQDARIGALLTLAV
ncbi:MAG TPA: hypothetical protein VM260_05005 [Pirellula sp.]|nr:hypothetical protein [Pirellula sp.]